MCLCVCVCVLVPHVWMTACCECTVSVSGVSITFSANTCPKMLPTSGMLCWEVYECLHARPWSERVRQVGKLAGWLVGNVWNVYPGQSLGPS